MINLAQQLHPEITFYREDICDWLPPKLYSLIAAWDSTFHLPINKQAPVIQSKDSGLKTCGSNACLARVLGQNKGFCLSWLIVNKRGEVTVFRGLLRIEIDLVSSSISKVFAQEGVQ